MSIVIDSTMFGIGSLIVAIATFLFNYFQFSIKNERRLGKIESDVCTLNMKMGLIWNYIDDNMGKILHSPHTPDIDCLIERMPKLTLPEVQKLKYLLIKEFESNPARLENPKQRLAYTLYLGRLDVLMMELQGSCNKKP